MSKQKIVDLATAIVEGRLGVIDGCDAITRARFELIGDLLDSDFLDSDLLFPFRSLSSECDFYRESDEKGRDDRGSIEDREAAVARLAQAAGPSILSASQDVIDAWS